MNIEDTIKMIADYMSVCQEDLTSPHRDRHIVDCRKMIALILHEGGIGNPQIAKALNRDRTTVNHLIKSAKDLIDTYPVMKRIYNRLNYYLGNENQADQKPTGGHSQSAKGDAVSHQAG